MTQQDGAAFTRVLVPLDGSTLAEQALLYAAAVGGGNAELLLVAVVPPLEAQRDVAGRLVATVDDVQASAAATARGKLLRAAQFWLGDRMGIRFEVAVGDPAEEILRVASTCAADLIVLASHGRGAVGRLAFGSVADRVAHVSPIPVMIIRPQDAAAELGPVVLYRVVVPFDGSELAARALPVAEKVARRLGLPVVLVRAVDLAEILGPFSDGLVIPPLLFEDVETDARQSLETTAATLRAAGVMVTTEVWTGAAFNAIAGASQPGDIIVLASHGRRGVTRWLLGSVAEKLVRDGPVPVIIVPVSARVKTEGAAPTAKQPSSASQ